MADNVNNPPHYNQAGKYLWRYKYKNGLEDLHKAQWYLNKLIEVVDDS
jgi:cytochrome c biogenesis protein ResB